MPPARSTGAGASRSTTGAAALRRSSQPSQIAAPARLISRRTSRSSPTPRSRSRSIRAARPGQIGPAPARSASTVSRRASRTSTRRSRRRSSGVQSEEQTRASSTRRARHRLRLDQRRPDLRAAVSERSRASTGRSTASSSIRPDRIALFHYAHVPWMRPHQKEIDAADLPAAGREVRAVRCTRRAVPRGRVRAHRHRSLRAAGRRARARPPRATAAPELHGLHDAARHRHARRRRVGDRRGRAAPSRRITRSCRSTTTPSGTDASRSIEATRSMLTISFVGT